MSAVLGQCLTPQKYIKSSSLVRIAEASVLANH